jgi:hypothetical protein
VRFSRLAFLAIALAPSPASADTDRFAVAGLTEPEARTFLATLQDSLRSPDNTRLADLLDYPLEVNSEAGPRVIADRKEFLFAPEAVFPARVRQQVLAQQFDKLFVSWRGVMVGRGEVWFSGVCDAKSAPDQCTVSRIRVIAVNLDTPE